MKDCVISFENVNAGYGKKKVLRDINLEIMKGEVVCLLGPNGGGKSTFIKALCGQLKSVDGDIRIFGKNIREYSVKGFSKIVSVLFTNRLKVEHLSGRNLIEYGRIPYENFFGKLTDSDREIVNKVIELTDVGEFVEKDFNSLSDGQKQRILIARTVAQDCPVMILDEPASFLDIAQKIKLFEMIRKLSSLGVTIIAAVHELDFACKVSDKVICISDGECRINDPGANEFEKNILSSFGLDNMNYNHSFGFAEFSGNRNNPDVFVISSCGSGINVFRKLHKNNISFYAGILYTNDTDYLLARYLSADVVTEEPFEYISDKKMEDAKRLIDRCSRVIVTDFNIGECNRRIQELISYSENKIWQYQ